MNLNQSGNKYYPKIILGQNIPLRVQLWEMWKVSTSGRAHMQYGKKFWTLQGGGVENAAGEPRALGGQSEKTEG